MTGPHDPQPVSFALNTTTGGTDLVQAKRDSSWLISELERKAVGTRRAYLFALTKFAAFAADELGLVAAGLGLADPPPWWSVIRVVVIRGRLDTANLVVRFATEACAGLAPATIAQRLAAVRWALGLLYGEEIIDWMIKVRSPKITSYRDTAGPQLDEIHALLAAADAAPGLRGLRDAALVRALFVLGLRRGEITSLGLADWHADRRVLAVLGKGRVDRQLVSVPLDLAARIDAYVTARGILVPAAPLFATHGPRSEGRPLQGDAIRRILIRLSKAAGLPKPVRPHGLRHSAITAALDRFNGDVRRVARFSRHAKIETVIVYDDNRKDLAGEVSQGLEDLVSDPIQTVDITSENA